MSIEQEIAGASPRYSMKIPFAATIGETYDAVAAAKRRWEPSGAGQNALPGLVSAGPKVVGLTDEITQLAAMAQEAHVEYLIATSPSATKELLDEANRLVSDMEAAFEFAFDDGVADEKDDQLDAIKSTRHDTIDGTALDLDECVGVARRNIEVLRAIPAFDPGWIDRAEVLAKDLRALPPPNLNNLDAKEKLAARNRILNVLADRMSKLRRAASFIFRRHPAIYREFTSTYERRRRAAARKKALAAEAQTDVA